MRIVELLGGLGRGGAELSVLRRLGQRAPDIETSIIFAGAYDGAVLKQMARVSDNLREVKRSLWQGNLETALRELQPDLVLVHTPKLAVQLLARKKRAVSCPVVVVAHSDVTSDHPVRRPLLNLLLAMVNKRADLHIAVSRKAAEGAWCRSAKKVVVCPLGSTVDLEQFDQPTEYWPVGSRIRLLSLSRLAKPKNLIAAVKAVGLEASTFRDKGAHLAIVGDGPERRRIDRTIRDLGVGDLISLHPSVTEVGRALKATDWLFVTSLHEGGPLTVFEAQLSGCRVASTDVGVVAEVLVKDPQSLMSEGASIKHLRQLFRSALELGVPDPPERDRRRLSASRWSVAERSAAWYSLLRDLNDLARDNSASFG